MCACQLIDINFYCLTRNTSLFTVLCIFCLMEYCRWEMAREHHSKRQDHDREKERERERNERKRIISKDLSFEYCLRERSRISTHEKRQKNEHTLPNNKTPVKSPMIKQMWTTQRHTHTNYMRALALTHRWRRRRKKNIISRMKRERWQNLM